MTSRSRGVTDCRQKDVVLWSGFVRKSNAPALIACTVVGTSPSPVMKMMGLPMRRFHPPALCTDEDFERLAHGYVVVNEGFDL